MEAFTHSFVDQQVLRLQIAVQDSVLVAEGRSLEQLEHEAADRDGVESASVSVYVHVPLQVRVHVLKDEHQLRLGVNDIVQADNVRVAKLLHERDLADRRRGCAFFGIEVDLLQRNDLGRVARPTLQDKTGSATVTNPLGSIWELTLYTVA